nr:hypothetical protein [uncultured Desulfobulbus sp.]
MSFLIPIALLGWIPLTILLFLNFKPHHAAMVSVIGGTLFLPMAGYDLPGLPPLTKNSVIGIGLLLGSRLSGQRRIAEFSWSRYDLPMLIWCLCPLPSSLSNDLGLYDGLAGIWTNLSLWGIPYLAGRVYINSSEKLRDLCVAIAIGGLVYLPLCLFEIRMSPQLSNIIYGFFPHDWVQHIRYGGFRPIVFMQHGLMVALWMAVTTTATFWLWRAKVVTRLKGIPISLCAITMIVTTILCKSANGWITLAIGLGSYFLFRLSGSIKPFRWLIILIPCYMLLRITGGIEAGTIETRMSRVFDSERVSSLTIRLQQEDLFIDKMLRQPIFGWGIMGKAWPRVGEDDKGKKAIGMIDALWLIVVSTRGLIGIIAMTSMMLIGPWRSLPRMRQQYQTTDTLHQPIPLVLSLTVLLFMIDSLFNGMINLVYILVSGALLGWSLEQKQAHPQ